jgi:aryl-alcohol dehydrogenase-like predicted oxidoreductase
MTIRDTMTLAGQYTVRRLGFGAMRITGDGIWGPPQDPAAARDVLRRAIDLGVNLIDTADSYGPHVSEELIGETLAPYPEGLVIATKGGFERSGPHRWHTNGHPDHLRAACDGSLGRLRLERIDLYQLHRIDPAVALEDQIGTLIELREAGKINLIGLSEVSVEDLARVQRLTDVASVQNRYNVVDRRWDDVVDACTGQDIAFIPWSPLAIGRLAQPGGDIDGIASARGATPGQVALSWLLHRSPVVTPIPGTSSVAHLEDNVAAADLALDDADLARLDGLAQSRDARR